MLTNNEEQNDVIIVDNNKRKQLLENNTTIQTLVQEDKKQLSPFYKWCAADDLLLKNAIEKNMTLDQIAEQVLFCSKYTTEELSERWRALLFDQTIAEYVFFVCV